MLSPLLFNIFFAAALEVAIVRFSGPRRHPTSGFRHVSVFVLVRFPVDVKDEAFVDAESVPKRILLGAALISTVLVRTDLFNSRKPLTFRLA